MFESAQVEGNSPVENSEKSPNTETEEPTIQEPPKDVEGQPLQGEHRSSFPEPEPKPGQNTVEEIQKPQSVEEEQPVSQAPSPEPPKPAEEAGKPEAESRKEEPPVAGSPEVKTEEAPTRQSQAEIQGRGDVEPIPKISKWTLFGIGEVEERKAKIKKLPGIGSQ